MATPQKRKAAIVGMSDLKSPSRKQRKANDKVTKKSGLRTLKEVVEELHPEQYGLMDDLYRDYTPGLHDGDLSDDGSAEEDNEAEDDDDDDDDGEENDDDDGEENDDDDGEENDDDEEEDDDDDDDDDDKESGDASEAAEVDPSEVSDDHSSVDEEEVARRVKKETLNSRARGLRLHNNIADRVAFDNQFVSGMTDEELRGHVIPVPSGGHYDLVPLKEGEKVPAGETVDLVPLENGGWYDPETKEVYEPTDFVDPKTNKLAKTVRRHHRGAPKGHTCKVRLVSAKDRELLDAKIEEAKKAKAVADTKGETEDTQKGEI